MYRQRKRDLNLKPNRQLDKRSSRGMIYENEELRMRTIAICEDVDRGQSDIKKLRKENDHLKREIWGLRDECEKLEEMLKKVCISANIPEITLDVSSKRDDSDDDTDDDEDHESTPPDEEGDDEKGKRSRRKRRESGASVTTFDSEVGTCMTTMFGDGDQYQQTQEDICFADEDPGSVIMNISPIPVEGQAPLAIPEPEPGPSSAMIESHSPAPVFHPHPSWAHHSAVPSDLEAVTEESESAVNSPVTLFPNSQEQQQIMMQSENIEMGVDDNLPDPSQVVLTKDHQADMLTEGRKTPVIQITPASSPTSNCGSGDTRSSTEDSSLDNATSKNEQDTVQTYGCITVVPKTFKVTSEIVVGNGGSNEVVSTRKDHPSTNPFVEIQSKSVELPRKSILTRKQDSDPTISSMMDHQEEIIFGGGAPGAYQRRSCYFPGTSATMPQAPGSSRQFGVLQYCCCNSDMMLGGYQSEPSLNSPGIGGSVPGGFVSAEEPLNFFNAFCCRAPQPGTPPITLRSVWNTVDRNIVIGFYGYSTSGAGGGAVGHSTVEFSGEPKVQAIIDELEAQFDPTLENILGIRLIPGRIFISLKNASVVKAFLQHFKNDLILQRKQHKIRIHFIEGATAKLSTTLVLSGIPPELPDLAVISALNQFGQVVAPLERRNYKGIDISERIAKMHLVINESSIPESVNVSGYEVRIRMDHTNKSEMEHESKKVVTCGQQQQQQVAESQLKQQNSTPKYGFVPPAVSCSTSPTLKPHKPVTRSSSSAPRLETPGPGQVSQLFPSIEQKRQSSVCVANIPPDQHPAKLLEAGKGSIQPQPKVTMSLAPGGQDKSQQQASSTPNLQPSAKKPLARLLVSSPGSFSPTSPNSPSGSPFDNITPPGQHQSGTVFKQFCRNIDPRRGSAFDKGHAPLTPSSSYSPRTRRKSSVQFAGHRGKGKREPLPWCGCWGLGCG